ncbi:hypothetical protein OG508_07855 [Streptomyces sp. NBC_01108]|uniref:hypothetical protein n=1 Tax=Streptomyces sp. NBC_01108 TaxID=2903751 RepID=UPI0038733580|nr:hypothetical protein OG508_07855 [Streptomyces sp. NBC_01108]
MAIIPAPGSLARSPERARLLKALAERRSGWPGIPRRHPAGPLVTASYAQAGLWMVAELEQGASAYTVPLPVSLRGPLDTDALQVLVAEDHRARQRHRRDVDVSGRPYRELKVPGAEGFGEDRIEQYRGQTLGDVPGLVA